MIAFGFGVYLRLGVLGRGPVPDPEHVAHGRGGGLEEDLEGIALGGYDMGSGA